MDKQILLELKVLNQQLDDIRMKRYRVASLEHYYNYYENRLEKL